MRWRRRTIGLDGERPSVELLSPSNHAFCRRELTSLVLARSFGAGEQSSFYARRVCPSPLSALGIAASELATLLGKSLAPFDRVEAGPGRRRLADCRLFAFGPHRQCAVLFNRDDHGIVHDLWLQVAEAGTEDSASMAAALGEIGRRWALLLVDWRAGDLIALPRSADVRAYLARQARPHGDRQSVSGGMGWRGWRRRSG